MGKHDIKPTCPCGGQEWAVMALGHPMGKGLTIIPNYLLMCLSCHTILKRKNEVVEIPTTTKADRIAWEVIPQTKDGGQDV